MTIEVIPKTYAKPQKFGVIAVMFFLTFLFAIYPSRVEAANCNHIDASQWDEWFSVLNLKGVGTLTENILATSEDGQKRCLEDLTLESIIAVKDDVVDKYSEVSVRYEDNEGAISEQFLIRYMEINDLLNYEAKINLAQRYGFRVFSRIYPSPTIIVRTVEGGIEITTNNANNLDERAIIYMRTSSNRTDNKTFVWFWIPVNLSDANLSAALYRTLRFASAFSNPNLIALDGTVIPRQKVRDSKEIIAAAISSPRCFGSRLRALRRPGLRFGFEVGTNEKGTPVSLKFEETPSHIRRDQLKIARQVLASAVKKCWPTNGQYKNVIYKFRFIRGRIIPR